MSKLKGLLLTEGMHGMISQVEGLAKALDIDFMHQKVELNIFGKFTPPKLTPVSNLFFKKFEIPEIDIVISCGRKSVIPSIYLKKKLKKKIISIHIQDPKVSLDNFDYVIVPEHDGLKGDNVITSKGAIHYLTIDEINQNQNYLIDKLNKEKEYLLFILGGPNKYYNFKEKYLLKIFEKVKKVSSEYDLQAIIIPSMRTPKKIISLAQSFFDKDDIVISCIDKKAYLSGLSLAKYIFVTCDSTSMISEAAITGKPVYVIEIPSKRDDYRFRQFRNLFMKLNIIRVFDNKLETWKYEKLDETQKIAEKIKKNL